MALPKILPVNELKNIASIMKTSVHCHYEKRLRRSGYDERKAL